MSGKSSPRHNRVFALARRHPAVSLVASIAVLALGMWVRSYLQSPYRVMELASSALNKRDASRLVALAGSAELKQLRISPSAAEGVLRESVWRGASDVRVTFNRVRPHYADVLIFDVDFIGDPIHGRRRNSEIWIYRDAGGTWRLALSHLLYALQQASGDPNVDQATKYDAAARRAGLLGCMLPGGSTRWAADGSNSDTIVLTASSSR